MDEVEVGCVSNRLLLMMMKMIIFFTSRWWRWRGQFLQSLLILLRWRGQGLQSYRWWGGGGNSNRDDDDDEDDDILHLRWWWAFLFGWGEEGESAPAYLSGSASTAIPSQVKGLREMRCFPGCGSLPGFGTRCWIMSGRSWCSTGSTVNNYRQKRNEYENHCGSIV